MTGSLGRLLQVVLQDLNARGPEARNRADLGDSRALETLIPTTLREHDARVLSDPGAWPDLEDEAPELADEWARWRSADLGTEATWRSELSRRRWQFGEREVDAAQLWSALFDTDEARREAGWETNAEIWAQLEASASGWAHAESRTTPEPETSTLASGLVLPDASMIAAVLGGVNVAEPVAPKSSENSSDERSIEDVLPLIEVARALWEATASTPATWPNWQVAIQGARRDFRTDEDRGFTGRLPYALPFVPLQRGSTAASLHGHAARALLGRRLTQHPARAAACLSRSFVGRELSTSRAQSVDWLRELGLTWVGLAVESLLADLHRDDPAGLVSATRWIAGSGAPSWWCRVVSRVPSVASRPGEQSSLYAHSSKMWTALAAGLQEHLRLRDLYDEDWYRDERVVATPMTGAATDLGISDAVRWLRDLAEI